MTTEVYNALQTCISLARYEQISCFEVLKQKALEAGHAGADIDAALNLWRMPDAQRKRMYGDAAPGRYLH